MSNQKGRRVAKDEWLSVALQMLESGGVDHVRIDRIARRLKTSRSGFYWHFRDRKELLHDILEYWTYEYTMVAVNAVSAMRGTPKERLKSLMDMVHRHDLARYDMAIRAWAKSDEVARRAVRLVNKARLDFVRSLFSEVGFKGADLEMRTMLFVCYHTWERAMFTDVAEAKLVQLRDYQIDLLTSPLSK